MVPFFISNAEVMSQTKNHAALVSLHSARQLSIFSRRLICLPFVLIEERICLEGEKIKRQNNGWPTTNVFVLVGINK